MNENQNKRTACIKFAVGCPRSMLDAMLLKDYLRKNGWCLTDNINSARLILLGVCGFDDRAERVSRNIIRIVLSKIKNALLVPFGCLCNIDPSIASGNPDIIPLDYNCLDKIDEIINAETKIRQLPPANIIEDQLDFRSSGFTTFDKIRFKLGLLLDNPFKYLAYSKMGIGPKELRRINKKDFFIRIVKGCNGHCSYCAIKTAAGYLNSYSLDTILGQFEKGLNQGYRLFRLIGEDVGGYGQDCGTDIVTLFDRLFQISAKFQIVIEDFSPKWLIRYRDNLIKLFAANVHCIHHIVLPLQSGSETLIRKMGRGYTVKRAANTIQLLQAKAPGIKMATHIIVGFPGETDLDFKATVDILQKLHFDHIEAHCYSDRPNSVASRINGKVSERIKIKRLRRLRQKFPDSCRVRL